MTAATSNTSFMVNYLSTLTKNKKYLGIEIGGDRKFNFKSVRFLIQTDLHTFFIILDLRSQSMTSDLWHVL